MIQKQIYNSAYISFRETVESFSVSSVWVFVQSPAWVSVRDSMRNPVWSSVRASVCRFILDSLDEAIEEINND